MKYILWHDNDYDFAQWVYENSILSDYKVIFKAIPKTNSKTQILDKIKTEYDKHILPLIKLDTPDLILQRIHNNESKIIFITEFMTHTPQWQHPAQRFSRLYNAAFFNCPSALVLPGRKIKLEKKKGEYEETQYTWSPSVFQLFFEVSTKTNTPTLMFRWPDNDGYLKYHPRNSTAPMLENDIIEWIKYLNLSIKNDGEFDMQSSFINSQIKKLENKGDNNIDIDRYGTIEGIFNTDKIIKKYNLSKQQLSKSFIQNQKTLIFAPKGLTCNSQTFRTDPYAGMLCAFDIMFCRDEYNERHINLLLLAEGISLEDITFPFHEHDERNCPFLNLDSPIEEKHLENCIYCGRKYRRIYGEISDVIIFKNNIYYNKKERMI